MTLPELHLADWRDTKDTLHLYSQIVGKIRMATTAPRNHWWNVPLYVDVRGLTTRRLHHNDTTFEITLDFVDQAVIVRTADGRTGLFGLGGGLPVADFDAHLHELLNELGVDVEISEEPFGVPMTTPFREDVEHASWDREAIARFGRILDWSDSVFEEFSAGSTARRAPYTCSGTASISRSPGSPAGRGCRWTPIRSPRRRTRRRSSRSGSGPATTTSATPRTTPTPPPSPRGCATSRCRRANGSSSAPARWRSFPTRRCAPRQTPDGHCSRSARAPTGPRPTRRLGHRQLRVDLVPEPGATPRAPRRRRRRIRPNDGEGSTRMTHAVALGGVRTASVSVARAPAARTARESVSMS